ncbi:MAG: hypothetical protein ABW104_16965 [Candidatus Thiodiazotropha sp. 6PLUC2]
MRFIFIYLLISGGAIADEISPELVDLSERRVNKYHLEPNQRAEALEILLTDVENLVKSRPGEAPPLVWQDAS